MTNGPFEVSKRALNTSGARSVSAAGLRNFAFERSRPLPCANISAGTAIHPTTSARIPNSSFLLSLDLDRAERNRRQRLVTGFAGLDGANFFDHVHSFGHFAEHGVLAVQPRRRHQ